MLCLIIISVAIAPFPSQADEEAPALTVSLTPAFASDYIFRGVRLGGQTFEPSVTVTYGSFTAFAQALQPIANRVPGQSDPEIDFYLGWSTTKGNWSFSPGATLYTYLNADTTSGFYKATIEPVVALSYANPIITITNSIFYDVTLRGPTFELAGGHTWTNLFLDTDLTLLGTVGTFYVENAIRDANPRIKNRGSYYLAGISLTHPFKEFRKVNTVLQASVVYHEGFHNDLASSGTPWVHNPSAVGRFVATVVLNFSFSP